MPSTGPSTGGFGQLPADGRTAVARSMVQLGEATFRSVLREELSEEDWIDDDYVLVELSGKAGEALWRCGAVSQRFFRSSVRYLGPLREAPARCSTTRDHPSWTLECRGEYSAAVLHAQAEHDGAHAHA